MYRRMRTQRAPVTFERASSQGKQLPVVLFVCVHNAGRSRMAEAWLNHLAGDRYRGLSAGTDPAPRPYPEVVAAMAEVGIGIPEEPGRALTRELAEQAVRVVGMGCSVQETCPALTVPLEDWDLPDPRGLSSDRVAEIRDLIELRVRNLVASLDRERSGA